MRCWSLIVHRRRGNNVASRSATLYWFMVLSVSVGMFAAVFPFSPNYSVLRPELLCLLVIYWVSQTPQYAGVLFAWSVGIAQDVIEGITWGGHAMALAIVAYICIVAHQRIKNYSVWHQTLWVFVLVGFHQVMVNWMQSLAGYKSAPLGLIISTAVSALFWPLLYLLLTRMRLNYRTH